jgi:hypothetical protein
MSSFPPLRLAVLTGLIGLKNHLDTLDDPSCPYDEETKTALRDLLAPKEVQVVIEKEVQVEAKAGRGRPSKDVKLSSEDQEMVLNEIKAMVENLKNWSTENLETAQKIQIAKTKTNLLDQLLKMMERHTTTAKMSAFVEQVVVLCDELMSEADYEIFMKRLEPYR